MADSTPILLTKLHRPGIGPGLERRARLLEHLVEWKEPRGTFYFAIAVAAVTAALIAFSYFGERD